MDELHSPRLHETLFAYRNCDTQTHFMTTVDNTPAKHFLFHAEEI